MSRKTITTILSSKNVSTATIVNTIYKYPNFFKDVKELFIEDFDMDLSIVDINNLNESIKLINSYYKQGLIKKWLSEKVDKQCILPIKFIPH